MFLCSKGRRWIYSAFWIALAPGIVLAAEPSSKSLPVAKPPVSPLQSLSAFPARLVLDTPRTEGRVGILGKFGHGRDWDLTHVAAYSIADARIGSVDSHGLVHPQSNGATTLFARYAGKTVSIPVEVRLPKKDVPVDFAREIVPVLTKSGCNQGACHGGQHGKGGFRLSLLGYDPSFDYAQIAQNSEGRRVVVSDPERSILLQKPSLQLEHGGGERFKVDSAEYNLLRTWLEDGAPAPGGKEPVVTHLDLWPSHRLMVPGEQQQIIVRAVWGDGQTHDVTRWAQYDSLNDSIAKISRDGIITAADRGETYIMIRFAGQASVVQVISPYATGGTVPDLPRYNFIDDKLIAKWKELGLAASPLADDAEFFRRVHLDVIGTLPTTEEIRQFLADQDTKKRAKVIDRLLARPEFIDFWALKWGDLLRINRKQLGEKGMWSFYNWVRRSLQQNKSVDEFVREVITAEGSTYTEGPANFYRLANNSADWAENTAQLFLGVRMQCARCHHHPFEKWSQDDYYGLAAFFVRLGTKRSQDFGIFERETVVYLRDKGEQFQPGKSASVNPHPPDGPVMDDPFDRRQKLADWITARDNPFFARNIVNRFWGYFMGHGLVEPLDDMRATNPASNPELLEALAADFVAHGFDLKHLMRTIMNSRAYQLTSVGAKANEADVDNVHYTHYPVKRLTAEQLADAIDFATLAKEKYPGLPAGTRAIQLPDTEVRSFFLDVFGRPPRQITCECERKVEPNIAQAMHLLNGDDVNRKLALNNGRIDRLFKAKKPLPDVIEELYLTTLSRLPSEEEKQKALTWLARAATPREGTQDLLWALINSREFLFNH
jgi:hypothetical protein